MYFHPLPLSSNTTHFLLSLASISFDHYHQNLNLNGFIKKARRKILEESIKKKDHKVKIWC